MTRKNLLYAQSGGVTPVINATACGVIEKARENKDRIGKVYAGKDGIIGILREELIDTTRETKTSIAGLRHTSGAWTAPLDGPAQGTRNFHSSPFSRASSSRKSLVSAERCNPMGTERIDPARAREPSRDPRPAVFRPARPSRPSPVAPLNRILT